MTHSPWQVPQPGAVPLRPLGLGDLSSALVAILRRNKAATFGASALVGALGTALPLLTALVLAATVSFPNGDYDHLTDRQILALVVLGATVLIGMALMFVGGAFVEGMCAQVAVGAAAGRLFTLREAWASIAGRRLRLVGMSLLVTALGVAAFAAYVGMWVALVAAAPLAIVAIWGLTTVPAMVVLAIWVQVRVTYLATCALVIEDLSSWAALRRGVVLSRSAFWRLFAIGLLAGLAAGVIGGIAGTPFGFASQLLGAAAPSRGVPLVIIGQCLAIALRVALSGPITPVMAGLLYIDQRIRREDFASQLVGSN